MTSSVQSDAFEISSPRQWDLEELLQAARKVKDNAWTPLSRFRVGASVLTSSGSIYEGCNTESLIPILSSCAERNALNHAILHGESSFLAVAVVSDLYGPLLPCGACLQYMQEFARNDGRDILIICEGGSGERYVTSLDELLKGGFTPDTSSKVLQQSFGWTGEE
ncbi:MAG: cytidine deaminase [Pseudomonadota bacterium]